LGDDIVSGEDFDDFANSGFLAQNDDGATAGESLAVIYLGLVDKIASRNES
jgi:hypothetical protein